jgi:hypothetical protein
MFGGLPSCDTDDESTKDEDVDDAADGVQNTDDVND